MYFTGVSTDLDLRLFMALLMFAADAHLYRIKNSEGISLLFIIYPCLNYLVFRLLPYSSLFLPLNSFLCFRKLTRLLRQSCIICLHRQ